MFLKPGALQNRKIERTLHERGFYATDWRCILVGMWHVATATLKLVLILMLGSQEWLQLDDVPLYMCCICSLSRAYFVEFCVRLTMRTPGLRDAPNEVCMCTAVALPSQMQG